MRRVLAFMAWLWASVGVAAAGSAQAATIEGEVPTWERIAEVCGKAVYREYGSDPNLVAILFQDQCVITWPSLFLLLSTACQDQRIVGKCISDTFGRLFPLPVGAPTIMLSRCDAAGACFDIFEVKDPNGNGTRRPEVCGYVMSGKAIVRMGNIYVAVADLGITPACWQNNG